MLAVEPIDKPGCRPWNKPRKGMWAKPLGGLLACLRPHGCIMFQVAQSYLTHTHWKEHTKPVFFSFTAQEVLCYNGSPTVRCGFPVAVVGSQVSCSYTHSIMLPQGGQEIPEQSWAPMNEACRSSTIDSSLPVWSLWVSGVELEMKEDLCFHAAEQMRVKSGGGWVNKLSVFYFKSPWEFRIVKIIRQCAITRAIVCGSCWDSSDSYLPPHISHLISFIPLSVCLSSWLSASHSVHSPLLRQPD